MNCKKIIEALKKDLKSLNTDSSFDTSAATLSLKKAKSVLSEQNIDFCNKKELLELESLVDSLIRAIENKKTELEKEIQDKQKSLYALQQYGKHNY